MLSNEQQNLCITLIVMSVNFYSYVFSHHYTLSLVNVLSPCQKEFIEVQDNNFNKILISCSLSSQCDPCKKMHVYA